MADMDSVRAAATEELVALIETAERQRIKMIIEEYGKDLEKLGELSAATAVQVIANSIMGW